MAGNMVRPYCGSTIPSSLQPIMPCLICRLLQNHFIQFHESHWVHAKRDLKLSHSLFTSKYRFPVKRVTERQPAFTSEMFQVGSPCYLGLNSSRSVSINVNKTKKHFSRNIHAHTCFLSVSQFPIRETLFLVSVFVFQMQIKGPLDRRTRTTTTTSFLF